MIEKYLLLTSASILLMLGLVHLIYTFDGTKLMPKDASVQMKMDETHLIITKETTMWRAWIGFNASHSIGAIFFGLIYGYLALFQQALLFNSIYLIVVGLLMLFGYVVLGKLYWFRVPFRATVVSFILFALAIGVSIS